MGPTTLYIDILYNTLKSFNRRKKKKYIYIFLNIITNVPLLVLFVMWIQIFIWDHSFSLKYFNISCEVVLPETNFLSGVKVVNWGLPDLYLLE